MDVASEFPPFALRDYALIADGQRGGLIGPRGDLVWLCAPAWDSNAVFSTLIGGAGCYAVTPCGPFTWGGYYDRRSLIWNSRWVTSGGSVESREALGMPGDEGCAVVLRHIRVLDGTVRLRVVLDLRADFGAETMTQTRRADDGIWTGRSGPVHFRWSGAGEARRARGQPLELFVELKAGETVDLVLELAEHTLAPRPPEADQAWEATVAAWDQAVPDLADGIVGRRDAELALAVLTGLTSVGGGMTAAATMSLPERAREGRNYDYRYAWIRDQCYAGQAVAAHGPLPLVDTWVGFVAERLLDDGPELKPAYTVRGGPVPDEYSLSQLSGYPGGADKVGNWVNHQFQLDTFGEALQLFDAAAAVDRLDTGHWRAVEAAVAGIEARWKDADAGLWELDNQHWAHSRLTCVAGLRAIGAHAVPSQAARWSALADTILADAAADCLHPDGRWQRSPTDVRIDASLLMAAVRGALPPTDPRSVATLRAVEAELVEDDYVYRFRQDDRPPGDAEGAFLLCGFELALALAQQGEPVMARALFERNRAGGGSSGLLAEEYDVSQRQLRGNYPQAFVHALLLECSAVLGS